MQVKRKSPAKMRGFSLSKCCCAATPPSRLLSPAVSPSALAVKKALKKSRFCSKVSREVGSPPAQVRAVAPMLPIIGK